MIIEFEQYDGSWETSLSTLAYIIQEAQARGINIRVRIHFPQQGMTGENP